MLFAAGFGTRMGALTKDRPKPLVPVGGKPLLDHTLELVHEISPTRIVANTHYFSDQIAEHLKSTSVLVSNESPKILETGGGLRNALPLLGHEPVLTSNTDAIWKGSNPFKLLIEAWRPDEMDALLLCVQPENALGHKGDGDFTLAPDGRISRGPGLIYGGVQIIKTDTLGEIDQDAFSLNLVWDRMHARGRLFGLSYPGQWCDVGSPEGITLAEKMLGTGND